MARFQYWAVSESNVFDSLVVFLKYFLDKVNFEKKRKSTGHKNQENFLNVQMVN